MDKIQITKISKQLIAQGRIDEAFKLLLEYSRFNTEIGSKIQDNILNLVSQYSSLKSQASRGVISNSEEGLETSRLVHHLIIILNAIKDDVPIEKQQISIRGNNIIINNDISIEGNFYIEDEIKANENLISKLLEKKSRIKILFLASNPLNTKPLRLDKEMRDLELELTKTSKNRDLFEFIKFSAVRIRDLQDALLTHSPNFVHFSGHGKSDGIALLDGQTENARIIPSEALGKLFKLFSNDIACVFLNSCYSSEQAIQIKKYIPNVIGMNKSVADELAIEFATVFYKGISAGKEISFSFELAKNSIDLHNLPGSSIPVLL